MALNAASIVPLSMARKNSPPVSLAIAWRVRSSVSDQTLSYPSFRPWRSNCGIGTQPVRPAPIVYTGMPRVLAMGG